MILYFDRKNILEFDGIMAGTRYYGVPLGSGYVSEIVDHYDQIPFSETVLLNFRTEFVPTSGKLTVRCWIEDYASIAFEGVAAGAYVAGTTFASPYGVAPVVAEIDYTKMFEGTTRLMVTEQIDIGKAFNGVVPPRYRLIFENSTDTHIWKHTLSGAPVPLCKVFANYVGVGPYNG